MELDIAVPFRNGKAQYKVQTVESRGIFEATLCTFDGTTSEAPPENVVLFKSLGHWTGSEEDPDLLYELGTAIEKEMQKGDYILPEWEGSK
jgi:hypothetical protein